MSRVSHSARAAHRAVAVSAAAGLCALAAQVAPVAFAAKVTTTVTAPTVTAPAPRVRRAERLAKTEPAPATPVATPAVPTPPEVAVDRRHHGQAGAPAPGQAASSPAAGGSRHGDGEAQPAHERRRTGAGRSSGSSKASGAGSSGTAGVAGAVGSSGEAGPQAAEALARSETLARKGKKGGGGKGGKGGGGKKRKEREREHEREGHEKEGHEKEGSPPAENEGSSGQATGGSGSKKAKPSAVSGEAAPTALAAAVTSAVAATPAGGTGTASLTSLAPSATQVLGVGTAPAVHAARSSRHAVGPRASASLAASTAPATALLASSTASVPSGAAAHARSGLARSYASSSEPAIVHTITRIVNVVPGPVRILIAALIALALALGLRSLLSAASTRRLVRQRGELLEDVGLLQAALLPQPPARLGPVGTSVAYRPADGPGAGGDFYDVFALEAGQLAVIVGDVSGHGREALPHTALVRFTVRAYLEAGLDPASALQTAGTVLERQLGGSFATVLAAIYHPRERTLTYAAAGHPPPLVLGEPDALGARSAIAPVTASSAPPIGAGMRTGTRQTVVAIPGPARLCFHTDGVTEARVGEQLFGEARLARSLAALGEDAGAADLLDSVAAQTSARPDDMAACLLQVDGGAGAPAIVAEHLELTGEADEGRLRRFLEHCGLEREQAAESAAQARRELAHARTVALELSYEDGVPAVAVRGELVIRAAALSAVGAS